MRTFFAVAALVLAACGPADLPIIAVENGWARATGAGQDSGAIYLNIVNRGGGEDRLVEVAVPRARQATLHSSTMDGGVMRMRDLADGLAIPADTTIALAPGKTHIMLRGLTVPLRPGEQIPTTLQFAKAGTKDVMIRVEEASR